MLGDSVSHYMPWAATYFGSSCREVSWQLMSGCKLSDQQLYFARAFDDFGHIFLTCSKKIIKIAKVGKIFQCVTFYQYFLINDKSCYQLVMATRMSNINNSSTMISMRVMWHHFYIGLACQNCFAYPVLVLVVRFMVLSNFMNGLIKSNTIH